MFKTVRAERNGKGGIYADRYMTESKKKKEEGSSQTTMEDD